ncbi:MAG: hypothetical protein ABSA27_17625 [Terriglobales bacterium]
MITRLRNALGLAKATTPLALRFDRPLVLFQSDDWGRAGVRDREGWEELRADGLNLGEKPYDFYSLETAEDLHALGEVLSKHRDSTGRRPSMVMNFIMANVDFNRCFEPGQKQIPLRPLTEGWPGTWHRPRLLEAYQQGIREHLFVPALHGLTHFCERAVARELDAGGERFELVKKLWQAQTPYIHWRMPWIGYEYWDAEMRPARRFLSADDQRNAITRAAEIFRELFAATPFSACAPGFRANADSRAAWFENGVRVAQNGPGERKGPYLDGSGMLVTFRTVEMEPAIERRHFERLVAQVGECFAAGVPAVISIHSINFHSTIQDFRTPTLQLMDEFLTAIEKKWPNLLYLHDADLFSLATDGSYAGESGRVTVGVRGAGAKGQCDSIR